jgi:hypothetical protein
MLALLDMLAALFDLMLCVEIDLGILNSFADFLAAPETSRFVYTLGLFMRSLVDTAEMVEARLPEICDRSVR